MAQNIESTDSHSPTPSYPLAAWFLGPKAEHARLLRESVAYILDDYIHWRRNYFPDDPLVVGRSHQRAHEDWWDLLSEQLDFILNALKADFPFHSPRYIAHMLSEQTLPSVLGYFAGMLYNPNNVTDEAAPVTVRLELEVGRMVSEMLGYDPRRSWAHITSGGTIANVEALWIARLVQFIPFAIREYCVRHSLGFTIKQANGQAADIRKVSPHHLVHLPPDDAVTMPSRFVAFLRQSRGRNGPDAIAQTNELLQESPFNVARSGISGILQKLGMQPVVFASAAAHYSVPKAASVLGYGEKSVRLLPVTERFRLDTGALEQAIVGLSSDEYIAAVVAIVGTTEEGAVDAVHSIDDIRTRVEQKLNRSFWLHADAAWGGYVASLLRGQGADESSGLSPTNERNDGARPPPAKQLEWTWDDPEVAAAFTSLPRADSVTVDPHKMGYVPYPAGIIAFRNRAVVERISQRAEYISVGSAGISAERDDPVEINGVGPYILEGSKPGAAAASCWLAHKTIPLTAHGHGQLVGATLLNARKFAQHLEKHRDDYYSMFELEIGDNARRPFTFVPLYKPDTNIICFLAVPCEVRAGKLVEIETELPVLNDFNERIYERLSIPAHRRGIDYPYSQAYFVSRTRFDQSLYSAQSLRPILQRLRITPGAYRRHGLFVLRSTVMNPFYSLAAEKGPHTGGKDYLLDFVHNLHLVAHDCIKTLTRTSRAAKSKARTRT